MYWFPPLGSTLWTIFLLSVLLLWRLPSFPLWLHQQLPVFLFLSTTSSKMEVVEPLTPEEEVVLWKWVLAGGEQLTHPGKGCLQGPRAERATPMARKRWVDGQRVDGKEASQVSSFLCLPWDVGKAFKPKQLHTQTKIPNNQGLNTNEKLCIWSWKRDWVSC